MQRLQKVIAACGFCSRRKAEQLILSGRVKVNNQLVMTLGTKVSAADMITIDDKMLSKPKLEYYLLNKPRNIISSTKDEKNRKTVVDLIDTTTRIYPIGRLDYDTTGIILLTNDGKLANHLMHPKFQIPKTYIAKLNRILSIEDLYKLKEGIIIEGHKITPSKVKIRAKNIQKKECFVELTISQGQNHIVKKIFNSLGYDVIKLKREKYAFLDLQGLKSGDYRPLSIKEVKKLYNFM